MRLFTILSLLFISCIIYAQTPVVYFDQEITVTSGSLYGSIRPRIVLTNNNVPLIMWGKSSGNLYVSRWNGSSFTAPLQVNPTGVSVYTSSVEGPNMEARGDTVFISYFTNPTNASKIYIQASYDGGQTWQDTVRVDHQTTLHPYTPDISIRPGGHPYVAFEVSTSTMANPAHLVSRSTDGGQSFGSDINASVNGPGQPCECCPPKIMCKGNNVYVFYRNNVGNIRDIYVAVSQDQGQTFPTVSRIDSSSWLLSGCPSQGPDFFWSNDSLFGVWMSQVNNESRIIFGGMDGNNFGIRPDRVLDVQMTGILTQRNPTIAGRGDTLAACWEDNRINGNFNCYATFSTTGSLGIGSTVVALSDSLISVTGNQVTPDVQFGGSCFHFVYQNAYTNSVVYRRACLSALSVESVSAPYGEVLETTWFSMDGKKVVRPESTGVYLIKKLHRGGHISVQKIHVSLPPF